jgi:hypothetical protein
MVIALRFLVQGKTCWLCSNSLPPFILDRAILAYFILTHNRAVGRLTYDEPEGFEHCIHCCNLYCYNPFLNLYILYIVKLRPILLLGLIVSYKLGYPSLTIPLAKFWQHRQFVSNLQNNQRLTGGSTTEPRGRLRGIGSRGYTQSLSSRPH